MEREQIGACTLYRGDCREVVPTLPSVDVVITDPPYPNKAGHFLDGVAAARGLLASVAAKHVLVFWTEVEVPPVTLPHVATHIWYRTNTNRPNNYEPVFEFCVDGRKRASRVLPYCVIAPGLTGIVASGHPTEKHCALMATLIRRTTGTILDPFMGSGTTGVACVQLGRAFVGVEIERKYFDIACQRITDAYAQPDLFVPQPSRPQQQALFAGGH